MRCDLPFTANKWKEMGADLIKGLATMNWDEKRRLTQSYTQKKTTYFSKHEVEDPPCEQHSDDNISEGNSDSEPSEEDLPDTELNDIEEKIAGKGELLERIQQPSPSKELKGRKEQRLSNQELKKERPAVLPPIATSANRPMIFSTRSNKKESFRRERYPAPHSACN